MIIISSLAMKVHHFRSISLQKCMPSARQQASWITRILDHQPTNDCALTNVRPDPILFANAQLVACHNSVRVPLLKGTPAPGGSGPHNFWAHAFMGFHRLPFANLFCTELFMLYETWRTVLTIQSKELNGCRLDFLIQESMRLDWWLVMINVWLHNVATHG